MLVSGLESEGPEAVRRNLIAEIRRAFAVEVVLMVELAEREARATVIAEPCRSWSTCAGPDSGRH